MKRGCGATQAWLPARIVALALPRSTASQQFGMVRLQGCALNSDSACVPLSMRHGTRDSVARHMFTPWPVGQSPVGRCCSRN